MSSTKSKKYGNKKKKNKYWETESLPWKNEKLFTNQVSELKESVLKYSELSKDVADSVHDNQLKTQQSKTKEIEFKTQKSTRNSDNQRAFCQKIKSEEFNRQISKSSENISKSRKVSRDEANKIIQSTSYYESNFQNSEIYDHNSQNKCLKIKVNNRKVQQLNIEEEEEF